MMEMESTAIKAIKVSEREKKRIAAINEYYYYVECMLQPCVAHGAYENFPLFVRLHVSVRHCAHRSAEKVK